MGKITIDGSKGDPGRLLLAATIEDDPYWLHDVDQGEVGSASLQLWLCEECGKWDGTLDIMRKYLVNGNDCVNLTPEFPDACQCFKEFDDGPWWDIVRWR
jgi:hypothetical protein